MNRKSYPQDNNYKKGTWKGIKLANHSGRSASFTCPNCGELGSLTDHDIDDNGNVSPSVVCSYDCGFHEYIKLDGWKPE